MFIDLLELNHLLQNSMYHLEFRYLHMCTFLYMVVWTLLLMSIHVLSNNVWAIVFLAYFFRLSMLMEDGSCYLKIIELTYWKTFHMLELYLLLESCWIKLLWTFKLSWIVLIMLNMCFSCFLKICSWIYA